MRILVTGGMGDVGRPIVQWLLDKGHEVRVLDLRCEPPIEGAECRQGSILDFAALQQHMQGMEGVIHLAAYREPSMALETQLFQVNVDGTYKVFRAAADAGIQRVVCASSINALVTISASPFLQASCATSPSMRRTPHTHPIPIPSPSR